MYHTDVYFPAWLKLQAENARDYICSDDLHLTRHARERIKEKGLDIPTRYNVCKGKIIEIEVDDNNRVIKLLFRVEKENYDLCFTILCNRTITTVYGRDKNDNNSTLEKNRYISR